MTKALQTLADRPYGVVSRKQADEWLTAGLVRLASVSPSPTRGVAVNLTARGRGVLQAPQRSTTIARQSDSAE